jgi:hypothetical protein
MAVLTCSIEYPLAIYSEKIEDDSRVIPEANGPPWYPVVPAPEELPEAPLPLELSDVLPVDFCRFWRSMVVASLRAMMVPSLVSLTSEVKAAER